MSPHNYTYQLFFDPKAQAFVSKNGGDDGIRTHDPLLAGQVLSQLSYTPIYRHLLMHLLCKLLTLQCLLLPHGFLASEFTCFIEL